MAGLVPAIPILWGSAFHGAGITGTRPVMTWEGVIPGWSVSGGEGNS